MPQEKSQAATRNEFAELADEQQLPLWREFLLFIVENKKWWLIPILLVCGLLGALTIISTTGLAPLIYSVY